MLIAKVAVYFVFAIVWVGTFAKGGSKGYKGRRDRKGQKGEEYKGSFSHCCIKKIESSCNSSLSFFIFFCYSLIFFNSAFISFMRLVVSG